LLGLIRAVVDYGRGLAETLRQRNSADAMTIIRFGTGDLALILRRIKLGLARAAALIARVEAVAVRLDRNPLPGATMRPWPTEPSSPSPAPRPARARPAPIDPRLAQMPSVEEIAADVACRPIGAVLADICRDLGILPLSPAWQELHFTVLENGGGAMKLLKEMVNRTLQFIGALRDPATAPFPPPPACAATGPP
jgi:hypothetical protein